MKKQNRKTQPVRTRQVIVNVCLILCLVQTGFASIEWEIEEFIHEATPDQKQIVAAFPFTNEGDNPITITDVKTSCGCSTPSLDKKVYQPGEAGKLEVLFKFGNRTGRQVKTVSVKTDDSDAPTQTLMLKVEIPRPIYIQPKFLYWGPTEEKKPKAITVVFEHDSPVRVVSVEPNDATAVKSEIKAIEVGRKYEVWLEPTGVRTSKKSMIPVTIVTDLPYERIQRQTVYVRLPSEGQTARLQPLPVQLKPVAVWWATGEPPKPKTIGVTVAGQDPVTIEQVVVSSKMFQTEIVVVEAGRSYDLVVTPLDTSAAASASLKLETRTVSSKQQDEPANRPVVARAHIIRRP